MSERDIRILNVIFDPPGNEVRGELVLIRNTGSSRIDMSGWSLEDTERHERGPYRYLFPKFGLEGGGEVRVHSGHGVNDHDDLFWGRGWPVWNNTGDTAILRNANGVEIDRLRFDRRPPKSQKFPDGFLWGVATAGYQVEGSTKRMDWDFFTSSPAIAKRVRDNSHKVGLDIILTPPGSAVGHFDISVLDRDLDRAAALGVNTYRMSVEWARIEPIDTGNDPLRDQDVDMAAVRYYQQVIDAIRAHGMQPMVTLNHLTLPIWVLQPPENTSILGETMEDDGFKNTLKGWENGHTVDRFIRFVEYVVPRFKHKVDLWITINEPVGSMIGVGYLGGVWPPGFTLDGTRAKKAYFNLIRAHVRAYDAIKVLDDVDADGDGKPSRVSFAHAMMFARNAEGSINANAWRQFDYFYNWHILDAVIDGKIDKEISYIERDRHVIEGDEAADFLGIPHGQWHPRLDFLGLNYYRSVAVYWHMLVDLRANFIGGAFDNDMNQSAIAHGLVNDLGWEMQPAGISHFIREARSRYGLPTIVTENGIPETVDCNRSAHLVGHLKEIRAAMDEGAQVDGYVHWSLLDNFEWQENYRPQARFGLYTVDRTRTGVPRILTEGGLTFAHVIAQNGLDGVSDAVGMMRGGGNSIDPPTRLAWISYAGIVPDPIGSLVLHVAQLADQRLFALVQYPARSRWVRITDVAWDVNTARLTFTHSAQGEVPSRTFNLAAIPGRLAGQASEAGGVAVAIDIPRLQLAGTWHTFDLRSWFGFSRVAWDEPWRVRMLTSESGLWRSLPDVTFDDQTGSVQSSVTNVGVNGMVTGEQLNGTLTFFGLQIPVSLERAPNVLPFG